MTVRPMDIAPAGRIELPDSGLKAGWEGVVLLGLTIVLLTIGLVTLYSASSVLALRQNLPDTFYVLRQASGAVMGMGALAFFAWLPYSVLDRWSWPILWASVIPLIVIVLPGTESIAPEINGARRWLDIGVRVQPSDFAKVSVVLWTASMAVKKAPHFKSLSKGLAPFLVIWCVLLLPIALEPDLSTAVVVALLGVMVLFAAGARIGHFVFLGLLSLPFLQHQLQVGFRADRLSAFLDPASDPSGAGFQVHQSLVALGSGGVTGVGIGEGRQKFGFLPEAHNDFIFAMIGEEFGLIGSLLLISLYIAIVAVGFRIATRAQDLFGQLIAIGFSNLIALQAVLHMSVGLGLVPPTGLALPLVSYGRSNLIVTLAAIGILISVSRSARGGKGARA